MLEAHTEAAIERIREHRVVLAPQDTTILNYSAHPMTEGLGPINTKEDKNIGLILNDTLAFTEDGIPLGVLDAQCWARDAWVDVRFAEVKLTPPNRLALCPPLRVWAVYILERSDGESGHSPIEWMLITTAEVKDFEDAKKVVEWYSGRWGIEVYHRTLKSGCRIKDRQLQTADRLEASLGIDMVVAWRIYYMTMLGREIPDSD